MHAPLYPHGAPLLVLALASVLSAQTSDLDCSNHPLVPNRLALAWSALPDATSVHSVLGTTSELLLVNQGPSALQYELFGHVQAGGRQREVALGDGLLPVSSTASVPIDLAGLGIDLADLAFSGRLLLEARSRDGLGDFVDRAFAPAMYFHAEVSPTGPPELWIYGSSALRQFFNHGDLQYQVHTSSVPDPDLVQIFDGGAGIGSMREDDGPPNPGPRPRTPTQIGQPPEWEFCMRWVYESIDSGFGEDHYTSGTLMKARGMKVVVDHPSWNQPRLFFCNDDNGCFTFAADENDGFWVTIYGEARLGGDDNVTVRAFDSLAKANANDPEQVPQWIFAANPGGEPRRVYYQNGPSELSNLMAFGSFVFHWVDHQTSPRLAGERQLLLATSACPSGGSCQSGNKVRMAPGASNRKFLVGHEVGHWLHRQWTEDDMGYDNATWSANSSDPDCAFAGVGSHAMRSKEYAAGGFIEGFAHYLSLLAWNDGSHDSALFRYYKHIDDPVYDDMEAGNWRVDAQGDQGAAGGPSNWMLSACFVSDGHSVEMDWMRFFWDYRTAPGTPPTQYELFEHIAFTRSAYPWNNNLGTYDRMLEAILDPGLGQLQHANRFLVHALANGVGQ